MNRPDHKVYGFVTLISGATDEAARALLDWFNAGVDMECLAVIALGHDLNPDAKEVSASSRRLSGEGRRSAVTSGTLAGSHEGLAERVARIVIDSELDGVFLVVPDYIGDLTAIVEQTLPRMAAHGVVGRTRATDL